MKKTLLINNDIYEIFYSLENENKVAPNSGVFDEAVRKLLSSKNSENLEYIKTFLNKSNLNLYVYDIKKNEAY